MATDKRAWGIHLEDNADPLESLVHGVYREIARRPAALDNLKQSMVELLSYLASPNGRTDHNCRVVDTFFCIRDDWDTNWEHLPEDYQRLLEDMGGALHDTVSSPDIARNFESTPEQLLARAREL